MVVSLDGRTTDRLRYEVGRGCHLTHLDPIRGPRNTTPEAMLVLVLLGRYLVLNLLYHHRDH